LEESILKEVEKAVMDILKLDGVSKRFGGVQAVRDFDMLIKKGDGIVGLIGPNGAGKTTIFNLITGFLKVTSGEIHFKNRKISNQSPWNIATGGIGRTFQQNLAFETMTVLDNVMIAAHCHHGISKWESFRQGRQYKATMLKIKERALEKLSIMGVVDYRDHEARSLSHGHRKRLGVAAALACEPGVLLLDEPFAGMLPLESDKMAMELKDIGEKQGLIIVMIEHEMRVMMALCERIVVMNFGKKLAEGSPEEIGNNAEVIKAYLGQ